MGRFKDTTSDKAENEEFSENGTKQANLAGLVPTLEDMLADIRSMTILSKEAFLSYYNLIEPPFSVTGTDQRFVYLSESYRNILSSCIATVVDSMGLGVVYGQVGSGKSTLARLLTSRFEGNDEYLIAYIDDPGVAPSALLRNIMHEFRVDVPARQLEALKSYFKGFIYEQATLRDRTVILIIDEAQKLDRHTMELLRVLLNYEDGRDKLLQIILFGQTELKNKVDKRPNFRNRIVTGMNIEPMSIVEMVRLIKHRLRVAGRETPVFEEDAIALLAEVSQGLPRSACAVGWWALRLGCENDEKLISSNIVQQAAHKALRPL
ncbi:MAG: AAA family ATPase [Chloroflexota bacterium]|nr:AAA family ATPase [Chloroflexota bacterium]